MAGRKIKPENQALQDRICAVLADAWPQLLTAAEIAERVGGVKTRWDTCRLASGSKCRVEWMSGTSSFDDHPWNAKHHDGPVPQDSWETVITSQEVNPLLNRLARDEIAEKIKVEALRGVLWRWSGDTERGEQVAQLEELWKASS